MPSDLQAIVHDGGNERVLKVEGAVDLQSAPALQAQLKKALAGAQLLVVDLSGVSYMDSSGIATLIQGLKLAKKASVQLRLRNPTARVLKVLKMAQLTRLFTIEQTESS